MLNMRGILCFCYLIDKEVLILSYLSGIQKQLVSNFVLDSCIIHIIDQEVHFRQCFR